MPAYQCRKGSGDFLRMMKAVSPNSNTLESVNVQPQMAYLGVVNAVLLQQLYTRPFMWIFLQRERERERERDREREMYLNSSLYYTEI